MQPREDKQKPLEIKRSREEGKSAPISRVCNLSTPPQGRGQRVQEAPGEEGGPCRVHHWNGNARLDDKSLTQEKVDYANQDHREETNDSY